MGLRRATIQSRTASAHARTVLLGGVGIAAIAVVTIIEVAAGWVVATVVSVSAVAGLLAARLYSYVGMRNRFDAVAYLTNEAVVVVDKDSAFVYVSPSVQQVLGYSPDEYATIEFSSLVHPRDARATSIASEAARREPGATFTAVSRLRHKDGRWIWVEISGVNLLDDPKVRGVVNTLRDVGERVRAEEALRASSDRFHALVANSTDVLILLDVFGRTTFASPTVAPSLGVMPDDLIGVELLTLAHPSEAARAAQLFLDVIAEPGGAASFEVRVLRSDGRYIQAEVRLQNLLDDPAVGGVVVHARDVTDRRQAEQALRQSETRFRSLASSAPLGIFQLDGGGKLTYVNDRFFEITGINPDHFDGGDYFSTVHPEDQPCLVDRWARAIAERSEFRAAVRVCRPDGAIRRVIGETCPISADDGSPLGFVGMVTDVTDLFDAQQNASRFQTIIENTSDLVVITDGDGSPRYLNQAARRAFGVGPQIDIADIDTASFFTRASWQTVLQEALPAALEEGLWNGELDIEHPAGGTITPVSHVLVTAHAEDGSVDFVASISRDMSAQKDLEARLQHQADHDELTGLPNRKPLISYLEVALANSHRFGGKVAVLFLDLDRFKVVNDSLGHHAGDALLANFARRLTTAIRPHDRAGRFGGDEFVVICPAVAGGDELLAIADRIRKEVGGRFKVGDDDVFVSVSVGAALGDGGQSPIELLRDADAAMYEAKARGRDRVQLFDGGMRLQVVERLDVERELRRALERDELELYFQPVVDLPSGAIRGAEALIRWNHPQRGLLLPSNFLPVAEETGMIVDIGAWVLHRACEEARLWQELGFCDGVLPVYVNLSARQLVDAGLVTRVREIIDLTGVDPAVVHFEITEHALVEDASTTRSTLLDLREVGVRLALDDFGTGYSSLSYLKHFPVDVLKIDKTFVDGLGEDSGDAAITAAIVDVAQRLGLETVAEGVERIDQAEWLTALGCDLAQGYHFARPMDAASLRAHLAEPM